ncbi:hypothetical protein HA46_18425 [Pantoea septica]|uniref:Uncharacterized protein n=1 Tax=Pantoea septica TaxID=472695 RepID=A0ABX3UNG8_9GAMM|nr:hypothetical protein HA46_18425 [Pantoea septica]
MKTIDIIAFKFFFHRYNNAVYQFFYVFEAFPTLIPGSQLPYLKSIKFSIKIDSKQNDLYYRLVHT